MANSIATITKYLPKIDEEYKYASKTSVLDATAAKAQDTDDASSFKYAKISLQGLGDYSRNTGYVSGDATLTWETKTYSQDRGRKFTIDNVDNMESANLAFGMLAGEFQRTKVAPEFDAYRLAVYAADAVSNSHAATADLSAGADVLAALRTASTAMDNAEVPMEGRLLFITPALDGAIKDLATTVSREVLQKFSQTIIVPPTRFYTALTQYDGSTPGQEAGGYIKNASTGKSINFLVIDPGAVIQKVKHTVTKIITPEENQTSDAYMYFFRAYHDAFVLENKQAGIYCHYSTT